MIIICQYPVLYFVITALIIPLLNCLSLLCLIHTSLNTPEVQRSSPGKTPIQILHEYGTKSGNLPVYVLEKAEGEAHQPSFVFTVNIGDVSCTGMQTGPLCWQLFHEQSPVCEVKVTQCSSCVLNIWSIQTYFNKKKMSYLSIKVMRNNPVFLFELFGIQSIKSKINCRTWLRVSNV